MLALQHGSISAARRKLRRIHASTTLHNYVLRTALVDLELVVNVGGGVCVGRVLAGNAVAIRHHLRSIHPFDPSRVQQDSCTLLLLRALVARIFAIDAGVRAHVDVYARHRVGVRVHLGLRKVLVRIGVELHRLRRPITRICLRDHIRVVISRRHFLLVVFLNDNAAQVLLCRRQLVVRATLLVQTASHLPLVIGQRAHMPRHDLLLHSFAHLLLILAVLAQLVEAWALVLIEDHLVVGQATALILSATMAIDVSRDDRYVSLARVLRRQ